MTARARKSDEQLQLVKKAAVLRSQGKRQKRIATLLQVSQGTVSKLLKIAKEKKILLPRRPVCLLDSEEVQGIERELFNFKGLVGTLRKLAEHEDWPRKLPEGNLHVFWAGADTKRLPGQDHAVRNWGRAAAAAVHSILERCAKAAGANPPPTVGVTWGRHLRSVTDGLLHLDKRELPSPVEFVPLRGLRLSVTKPHDESVFTEHPALSSTALVGDLHKALNHTQGDAALEPPDIKHWLPVPDLIPFDPTLADFDHVPKKGEEQLGKREGDWLCGVKRAYGLIDSYRRIFGASLDDEGALANQLSGILTALGPPGGSRSFSPGGGDYGGVPQWWTEWFSHGDIGGVLLPKEPGEIEEAAKKVLVQLNVKTSLAHVNQQFARLAEHSASVQLPHIRHCADNAQGAHRPGVIGLAIGEDRAIAVLTALRRGLLNHVIIDPDLGRRLLRKAKEILKKAGVHFSSARSTS
jgi:DNA-binding transcriptional regulator LsrR (DeoR family)